MIRSDQRGRAIAILLLVSSLFIARPARATVDVVLRGVVQDSLLQPLPGATVVLHDAAGNVVGKTVTGADGTFSFSDIPFGDYTVEASKAGLVSDHKHLQIGSSEAPLVTLVLVSDQEVINIVEDWSVPEPTRATASVATIGRQALSELPGAEDRPITDVIATQPGFVVDALGNVYARGNHANIQYQIDGIPIPDSVGSLFAASIPVRLIQNVEIYTGGMPAEFGDRLGAVVNIGTRRGSPHPEGAAQVRYGSYNTVEPGAYYATQVGDVGVLVGGSYLASERALDPPSITPVLHDDGSMGRVFARLDDDLGQHDRVEAFATYAHNRFQIPLDPSAIPLDPSNPNLVRPVDQFGNEAPAFVPHDTDARETEDEIFATVSWVHTNECGCRLQIAPFYKLSRGVLLADAAHALGAQADLGSTASDVSRTAHHLGGVVHYSVPRGGHVIKTGAQVDYLLGRTDFTSYVRDDAAPTGGIDESMIGRGTDRTNALATGAYLEDNWTAGRLVLTPGLRVDELHVIVGDGSTDDSIGVSPRLGASLALSDSVVGHVFTGINWQPPSPLDAANAARALGVVSAGTAVAYDLKPETDFYNELGLDLRATRWLRTGATAWGRYAWNQLDDTAIGSTSLLSNYNFERGRAGGVEGKLDLRVGYWISAFGNVSYGFAQGQGISSAKFLFGPDDLANRAWQTLDHAQTATANLGATVRDGRFTLTALGSYGSGLRTGPSNTAHVPAHLRADLSMQYTFEPDGYPIKVSVDVVNVFNDHYAYRIANGFVGSSYGPPRTVYLTLSIPLARVETAAGGAQ